MLDAIPSERISNTRRIKKALGVQEVPRAAMNARCGRFRKASELQSVNGEVRHAEYVGVAAARRGAGRVAAQEREYAPTCRCARDDSQE